MIESSASIVVWCFKDGRRGHENQSLGLLAALGEIHGLDVRDIVVEGRTLMDCWQVLRSRFPPGEHLPAPMFHLGAGHRTHLPMLAARRARGGKTIVLMNPTLPRAWFDLCIVPEHDMTAERPNILRTRGVLNRLRAKNRACPSQGLFLIGGPSTHHGWSEKALLEQIRDITQASSAMKWVLATSPRTPRSTTKALGNLTSPGIKLAPFESVDSSWLPQRLNVSSQVWVTEDSVSMVYEALTAGATVGLIAAPKRKPSRVSRGMDSLIDEGLVTPFARWKNLRSLPTPQVRFDEASRCAEWITDRWL